MHGARMLAHARKCSGRWHAHRSDARVELLLLVEKVCVRPQLLDVDPLPAEAEDALRVEVLEAEVAVHVVGELELVLGHRVRAVGVRGRRRSEPAG